MTSLKKHWVKAALVLGMAGLSGGAGYSVHQLLVGAEQHDAALYNQRAQQGLAIEAAGFLLGATALKKKAQRQPQGAQV